MLLKSGSKAMAKLIQDEKARLKKLGQRAKRFGALLNEIMIAENLEELRHAVPSCRLLRGDRSGYFALDVSRNERLILQIDNWETLDHDKLNFSQIQDVTLIEIEDYHG